MHFRFPESEHQYPVDLIPFGGVEIAKNTIAWPPDMAIVMNVAGFDDAFASAVRVEISPGIVTTLASLPGIGTLKLFAWAERRQENPKDAIDLAILLRSYHQAGNNHRIYEGADALGVLEAVEYDPELAGARLLGNDVAAMTSTATLAGLQALLKGATRDRLIEDMTRGMKGREDAMEYASRLLEQFTTGLTA